MKHAFKRLKHKPHLQTTVADKKKPPERTGPNWALLVVAFVSAGLVTFGLFQYVLLSKVPVEMLGQWVVVKSNPDTDSIGQLMEFHRDGSVYMKLSTGDEVTGRAVVENDILEIRIANVSDRSQPPLVMSFLVISATDTHMELERDRLHDIPGSLMQLERPTEANTTPAPKRNPP